MKSASVQKTRLWLTPNAAWGFYTRSSIAHGCAFHPCAIGDPRRRLLVRATTQFCEMEVSGTSEAVCFPLVRVGSFNTCLLYTSDAADDLLCVDLGGRR